MMMCVVTFVSLMVHIYTIGYMEEDDGYNRFFSYISLFTFSMLMLVMSNNLLQLFFGWEAVGLVSYLLIGFYYKKPTAIFANMKAFLVNRVGDFGFILGIGLIAAYTGTLNYSKSSPSCPRSRHPAARHGLAAGDRDLHLPVHRRDGQVGAVPAARLAAGLDGRPDPDLGADPRGDHGDRRYLHGVAHVAAVRAVGHRAELHPGDRLHHGAVHGFLGIIQNDIKRVIAYSTLSQLGYMTVALGVSAYSVAVFHLMTHAFFKALLFLGAGSVIMGMHHNQDIRWMGGVRKYMPITWITFLLGNLALIGTPFFSGFYSKDSIIEAVHASTCRLLALPTLRCWPVCSSLSIRSACTSWSSTARSATTRTRCPP
jgi:NADH-quinone oxidoreductase subunit L